MWPTTPQKTEKSTIVMNRTPADNSDACFRPKLTSKPNAQLSLEQGELPPLCCHSNHKY